MNDWNPDRDTIRHAADLVWSSPSTAERLLREVLSGTEKINVVPGYGSIDDHPLRNSVLAQTIESILLTRLHNKRLDGYTLETALAIADAIIGPTRQLR